MADRFTLTRGPDGIDVLHRNQREECDSQDGQRIDAETADALLAYDTVRRCAHCSGVGE